MKLTYLPVENNQSNSGTYKILPLYSESNENHKSSSSEGSDGTNLGSMVPLSQKMAIIKSNDNTNTGTFTTLGSQQEGKTEAILPYEWIRNF